MGKSIFEFSDKLNYNSPWEEDWTEAEFQQNSTQQTLTKKQVKAYSHPDKAQFKKQRDRAKSNYDKKRKEYFDYYKRIGKIDDDSTESEIQDAFSAANKKELKRLNDSASDNQSLYDNAIELQEAWNKLDTELENVVYNFNKQKSYNDTNALDPNLVKALMFSESEMGTGVQYKKLIIYIPANKPDARYQLNLGRVTDASVYTSVKDEFKINVDWRINYKAMGNENDVKLAAGAIIQKREYTGRITSTHFKEDEPWFNAIVGYKGVSAEGARKANLVWKLYTTGAHPYTAGKKLF